MLWKDESENYQIHFSESQSNGFAEQSQASSWLHCVVSIVLRAGRVKVSVYSVSGEGSLPSWLCAHTLEKEKAQISSSYAGTESMVSDPYP